MLKIGGLGGAWRAMGASGYLHVLSANAALQFLGFLSVLLVARMLEPVELALVRSTQAYFAVFAILAACGMTAPILRYCADLSSSASFRKGLMEIALKRTLAVSCAVVIVLVALCFLYVEDRDALATYLVFVLMLPAFSVTSLFYVYLQAEQRFAVLARAQVTIKLASVAVIVLATSFWGLEGFLIATLLAAYIAVAPLWKACGVSLSAPSIARAARPGDFDRLAVLSVVGMGLTTLATSADFMLLQFVGADRHAVGLYSLATIFLAAAMTITGAFQSVVTPKFTGLLASPNAFREKLRRWSFQALLLGLGSAVCCFVVARLLEELFFDGKYSGFSALLAVLLVKHVIWSSYAVAGAALVGAGILGSGVKISMVTTVLAFAIGYPLCLHFGVLGAAWMHVVVAGVSLLLVWFAQRAALQTISAGSA